MNHETVTDALLREFLLGKVNDEERQRIESLFLTDPQSRERVLGVEQDLIEDYLEGTLSAEDSERFVSRYAQTPEQRRKLRITKSIKDWAMTQAATQTAPAKISYWSSLRSRPSFVIPLAVIALIVIVVAAILLSRRPGHSAIEQELAELNSPSNVSEVPVALELSPVTVRGSESQTLSAHPTSGVVVLRLVWIQKEQFPSYQATIRRVADTQSNTVRNLQAESDGKAILIKLPAHILNRGTYQITLTGIAADGSPSPTEEYTFNVGG